MKILDVNAGFGFWPIQRFSFQTLAELNDEYSRLGVDEVWISAIESILFPEPDTYDQRLINSLQEYPRFRAVKTINPLLANWEKSLRNIHSNGGIRAIKLFPNYHGVSLAQSQLQKLCAVATELNLPVLIQMRVNDERNQPVCLQMSAVHATEIVSLSQRNPDTVIIALGAYYGDLKTLANGSGNLLADISFVDYANAIGAALQFFPEDRLLFGSQAPWLHPRAALMKLQHYKVPASTAEKVAFQNLDSRLLVLR